jgi:Rrf2 family nitric oxide-sensitive transcriptional repressor
MRLTQFTDYALRTLLYLGVQGDRPVPLAEIARSYRISQNHLVKVVGRLGDLGLVTAVRGRSGGYRLAANPSEIGLGSLVRSTEPDFRIVECFDPATDTCPITPSCMLRRVLVEAERGFLGALDRYTLADLLHSPERRLELVHLWAGARGSGPAGLGPRGATSAAG